MGLNDDDDEDDEDDNGEDLVDVVENDGLVFEGKEMRKAKLARSRSLSSHPTTPKMSNSSDKTL